MNTRSLGFLTLATAFVTAIWGILFAIGEVGNPPVGTLADRIVTIEGGYGFFLLNYANAGLLTIAAVATLAGFYVYCKEEDPLWSAVGLVFVPIYGLGNCVVYLSQVFVVPTLLDLYHTPETADIAQTLLALTLHTWSGSVTGFVNALSYALLGFPSIIFGLLMARMARGLRVGGLLLGASGLLSIVALVGVGIDSPALAFLSPVGGFVYMVGLVPLGLFFMREAPSKTQVNSPHLPVEVQ